MRKADFIPTLVTNGVKSFMLAFKIPQKACS